MQQEIEQLQIKIAFVEDSVEQMHNLLLSLNQQLQQLQQQLQDLKLQQLAQASLLADMRDESLPPHY